MNLSESTLKMIICLLFCTTAIMFSCKDDDDPVIDRANLAGDTWTFDHTDVGNAFASGILDALMEGSTYTFNADNTYEAVQIGFDIDGTWEYSNGTITLNPGEDAEEVWEVTELSPNALVYISTTVDDETEEETIVTFFYTR